MDGPLTPLRLKQVLPGICSRDTTYDNNSWSPENPLWGHCAVVSVLAQSLFGGEILFGKAGDLKHYWNRMPDGTAEDFTLDQFRGKNPEFASARRITNSLQHIRIKGSKRYKTLTWRLAKALDEGNPIFNDPIYQKCFYNALDSSCQKMKFGCVITHNEEIVYEGCNKTIGPLKALCQPKCIRLSIASRTESMLGACGHAEEGLWDIVRRGIPIHECDMYVAGLYSNGLPWFKKEAEHTCLRCAVQLYNAKIRKIYVPVINSWQGITADKALETALAYATQDKKV